MAYACERGSVVVPFGGSESIFDMVVNYPRFRYVGETLEASIEGLLPWLAGVEWGGDRPLGGSMKFKNSSDHDEYFTVTISALSESSVTVGVVRCGPLVFGFADVGISRRYGDRLYLDGWVRGIVPTDDICVYYSRPGDSGIRNLKADDSEYLHFAGSTGLYWFNPSLRYIEFTRAGYYSLQVWDIDRNCETPLKKRAEWWMNVILPRYQYQLIFDKEDPYLEDNVYLLEAEYAKYEAAGSWFVNHDKPDCFPKMQPINTTEDDTPQSGWLSLGVEFGESPCAPIPHYLCPFPTPQTQYWRGECSCDLFRETLQPLGIPCSHLIAAMNWYSGEPTWSSYVRCP